MRGGDCGEAEVGGWGADKREARGVTGKTRNSRLETRNPGACQAGGSLADRALAMSLKNLNSLLVAVACAVAYCLTQNAKAADGTSPHPALSPPQGAERENTSSNQTLLLFRV